jgi:hypothetical protein
MTLWMEEGRGNPPNWARDTDLSASNLGAKGSFSVGRV